MLDLRVIDWHPWRMEEALTNLGRYRDVPLEGFAKGPSPVWLAEKGLKILIQNALDTGAPILALEIRTDWDDCGEIISKLGIYGILPRDAPDLLRQDRRQIYTYFFNFHPTAVPMLVE
jgi:uncharacterized protein YutE (UPF0331/DUF86 family)